MAIHEKTYQADNRHEGPDANRPVQRLTASTIISGRIQNPQGEDLGKIDNLMVNIRSGAVEYAVVEFGSFLGIGGKLFAVPFNELRLNPAGRTFVLNRDIGYLKDAPGFDKSHWPDTNDHSYFENVRMYYGSYLPPFP